MTCNELVEQLHDKIGEMLFLIDEAMRSTGDTEAECQKLCLINRLHAVERAVNGVEESDLKASRTDCRR